jgi:hypothetical protein
MEAGIKAHERQIDAFYSQGDPRSLAKPYVLWGFSRVSESNNKLALL